MDEKILKMEKLKLHFKYIVTILILSNVMIAAFLLLGRKHALENIANAATLLSIVLAILAIFITLWDIAGQKDSIHEIRNEIEKVKVFTTDIKISSQKAEKLVKNLEDFESNFGGNFDALTRQIDDLIKRSSQNENGGSDKSEIINELNKIKEVIINTENAKTFMKKSYEANKTVSGYRMKIYRLLEHYFDTLPSGSKVHPYDVHSYIKGKLPRVSDDNIYTTVNKYREENNIKYDDKFDFYILP